MAKILEQPKSKPVTCKVCGCKYEFEVGDKLQPLVAFEERDTKGNVHRQVLALTLLCPACGARNNVEFIKDEEE